MPKTLNEAEELIIPPDGVKLKLDGVVDSVPPDMGLKCLMESSFMNNGIKMTVKILLKVMMATFC